jgi:hypothetical protein
MVNTKKYRNQSSSLTYYFSSDYHFHHSGFWHIILVIRKPLIQSLFMTISQDFSYVSSSDNSYIDGLYTADPRKEPAAEHIPVVDRITDSVMAMGGEPPPGYSSGGMRTKLIAARIATDAGCAMAIGLGKRDHPLAALLDGARCTW